MSSDNTEDEYINGNKDEYINGAALMHETDYQNLYSNISRDAVEHVYKVIKEIDNNKESYYIITSNNIFKVKNLDELRSLNYEDADKKIDNVIRGYDDDVLAHFNFPAKTYFKAPLTIIETITKKRIQTGGSRRRRRKSRKVRRKSRKVRRKSRKVRKSRKRRRTRRRKK